MGHRGDGPGDDRRRFLAGVAGAGVVLMASPAARAKAEHGGGVPPTEDLMREHGVLRRILLVYEEAIRKLRPGDAAAAAAAVIDVIDVVAGAANIVHRFVEGYHEKLEEEFVFPKLEQAGKLLDLTQVLRIQHAAGRKVTDAIRESTKQKSVSAAQRQALTANLEAFVRMYAPHAAWEDTELFPVFRQLYSAAELERLGDRFEDQEHKLLGGGEGSLKDVGDLEKVLGIHDLSKFTPKLAA